MANFYTTTRVLLKLPFSLSYIDMLIALNEVSSQSTIAFSGA